MDLILLVYTHAYYDSAAVNRVFCSVNYIGTYNCRASVFRVNSNRFLLNGVPTTKQWERVQSEI